ncbi:MAG: Gfo/Idh/MocA family oxidoreductase [Candidatus Hydrogenedentes bacterium]|nr:Gfo/Idh/MocA family oxidoreductase [Candidatus Hydrogenedentota bacterium]
MRKNTGINRRRFLQGTTAIATTALLGTLPAQAARVGHADKVRLAIIGCGGMGRAHAYALAHNEGCTIKAICDVYTKKYDELADNLKTITGTRPDTYQDFRAILERDDIDAVFVVTPDHWHPLITVMACRAAKDVYVEKPVCTTVHEGRAMVEAARRYGRVVQVGTQHRSMPVFQEALRYIRAGKLGHITSATAWIHVNDIPVTESAEPVPEGLDWDMWLGPAPWSPYSPERYLEFKDWHDYARGGELTNWGVHLMDVLHWGIGQDRPLSIQALGGSYRKSPGADNYETVEALFEYPGCTVTWEQRHVNDYSRKKFGMKFQGPEGRLACDRGILTYTSKDGKAEEKIFEQHDSWADSDHHNNFLHCVRTRQKPAADIEQGFRSTTSILLAGIALKTQRKLRWDGNTERFINDEQANRFLTRAYRKPWRL